MKSKALMASVVVALVSWLMAFWYEPLLPEQVPTHWNAQGEVDGWTAKPWGVYMMPMIMSALVALLSVLPKISPKGFELEQAKNVYDLIVFIVTLFMFAVMILSFETALNQGIDIGHWIMFAVGALFVLLGNYLSKVPKNFFLGIRTPWTLASDKVWFATHRLGSWCFVLVGLVVILAAIFSWPSWFYVGAMLVATLVPVLYSLYAYHRIEGFKNSED